LPGYFRPEKKWDLIVITENTLVAAIEFKSQVGPSFGNNYNNRTEEALGNATDLWTAYREGAFLASPKPWLGFMMVLEDCPRSREPVKNSEPHFKTFREFRGASYTRRYELLLGKLVRERLYDATCFLVTERDTGRWDGAYTEPNPELSFEKWLTSLVLHTQNFFGRLF
jgi:hypothetical protein